MNAFVVPSPGRLVGRMITVAVCLGAWSASPAADYEWTFSQGNLNTALGNGTLTYADGGVTAGLTQFGVTDGAAVPHIDGQAASYMRVPAFASQANGYHLTFNNTGPNGGGGYVNQYTFIFDVLSPGGLDWTPFFNTEPSNGNDADFYIAPDGAVGIGDLGYSAAGSLSADQWYRVAFAADLASGTVAYYVDGVEVARSGGGALDGRFSLYSNVDAGVDVLLFNEGDGSGIYTHELLVSDVFFTDRALTAEQVMALGGANALGVLVPEPSTWALLGLGGLALAVRRRRSA